MLKPSATENVLFFKEKLRRFKKNEYHLGNWIFLLT